MLNRLTTQEFIAAQEIILGAVKLKNIEILKTCIAKYAEGMQSKDSEMSILDYSYKSEYKTILSKALFELIDVYNGMENLELSQNEKDIFNLLITEGADINSENSYGRSLLHSAVYYNNSAATKFFIEAGSDLNIKSCDSRSYPLEIASDNLEMFKFLLTKGANPELCNEHVKTLALQFPEEIESYKYESIKELVLQAIEEITFAGDIVDIDSIMSSID